MKTICMALVAVLLAACANTNEPEGVGSAQVLEGSWRIAEVGSQSIPMQGSAIKMLRFETEASKFSGNAGCNRLFGLYEQEAAQLRFNGIATTRMACDPVSMQLERKVIDHMENVQTWQVVGDELRLLDSSNHTVLKLKRM